MNTSISSPTDLSKLKVSDLRKELKTRGLITSGNKTELLERLQSAVKSTKSEDISIETGSLGDLEEDLLNEEDDDHLEENDSVLRELDSTLDKSPTADKPDPDPPLLGHQGTKRSNISANGNGTQPKKIVLNRPPSTTLIEEATTKDETATTTESSTEKKVVKLSELSAKERLEMRAKKFGVPLSGDAKKEARAERFGTTKITVNAKSTPITASAPPSADVLKQRAERFGVKTSVTLNKVENDEKLEKRKARFGATVTAPTDSVNGSVTGTGDTSTTAKAAARLERFKQPVK